MLCPARCIGILGVDVTFAASSLLRERTSLVQAEVRP